MADLPKALIIDSDEKAAALISSILERIQLRASRVDDELAALELLKTTPCFICFLRLAADSPLRKEAVLSLKVAVPNMTLIVIAEKNDRAAAFEAIKAGAWAWIQRPIEADELLVAASNAIERWRLLTQRPQISAPARKSADAIGEAFHTRYWTQGTTDFIHLLAHELRNPIAALVGFSSGIAGRYLAMDQTHITVYMRSLETASLRLSRMLDKIADIGQIIDGGFAVDPQPLSLADLVSGIIEKLHSERADVKFKIDYDAACAAITSDKGMLEKALRGVLENAVAYSPQGGLVEIRGRADGDERVRITISDQGSGIPEAERSSVFQPFCRLSNGFTNGGLGLGLTISKAVMNLLGGRVEISTASHKGCVVDFQMPLKLRPPDGSRTTPRPGWS